MKSILWHYPVLMGLASLLCHHPVAAQDTLNLSLGDAERIMMDRNLDLLAEQFNIDISKAQLIQKRLYNNPNISLSGNFYNPDNGKLADVSNSSGEYAVNLQQLIILAGKRNKQVQLGKTDIRLAEQQFYELLRTLRYSLRSNYFEIYFLQNSMEAFQRQIVILEKLNAAYQDLQSKGVVTLRESIRIQSLLYSLQSDRAGLQTRMNELQAELQILLRQNGHYLKVKGNPVIGSPLPESLVLQNLIDTAHLYRYDFIHAQTFLLYEQQNLSLQKAMAVPDLTVGGGFDKRGSFVTNASFLNLSIDLPFFNRNQGNIKAARIAVEQQKTFLQQQNDQVDNEVALAFHQYLLSDKTATALDPGFRDRYEHFLQGVTDNFQQKNISLTEFADFIESYKTNVIQFNQMQNARIQALETLQFAMGKILFNNEAN